MRTIITGGTGLIGRALAASLVNDGHEVYVLSRAPQQHQASLPPKVRAVAWDGRSAGGWNELINGETALINLAGENLAAGPWTQERKLAILESRLNAGKAILQAVEKSGVKTGLTLIQSSAVGWYGACGDEIITEQSPHGKDYLSKVCLEWEASTASAPTLGVRRAVIRTGVVLSIAEGALPRLLLPFRLYAGGPLGSGRQWFPWIHLDDEIAAIRFLLQRPDLSGPFNLSAPQPLTNREFAHILGRVMNRPALLPAPAFALRLALGEMSTVVLDGQRAVPQRLLDSGFTFRYPQAEAALRDILK